MAVVLWHGDNESNDDSLFGGDCGATYISVPATSRSQGVSKRGLDSQQLARMAPSVMKELGSIAGPSNFLDHDASPSLKL